LLLLDHGIELLHPVCRVRRKAVHHRTLALVGHGENGGAGVRWQGSTAAELEVGIDLTKLIKLVVVGGGDGEGSVNNNNGHMSSCHFTTQFPNLLSWSVRQLDSVSV
jgi:hypothetical protein